MDSRNIFLVDGIGALVSTILLSVVLPFYQDIIGMPITTLYLLAFVAFILMLYSLLCFEFASHNKSIWLRTIINANLLYCTLTMALVYHHFAEVTLIGVAYFVAEITVVLVLVAYEQRICSNLVR